MRNGRFTWTEEQEKILLEHMRLNGNDQDLIDQKILPFTLNAIRKKKGRLAPKENRKKHIVYKPKVKNIFKDFLCKNWKNNTPEELAEMWNSKNNIKTTRKRVIFYLSEMQIKVPYNEIIKIKTYKKYINNLQYDKARSYKIKMFKERLERGLDLWTGLKLDPSIDTLEGVFIDEKNIEPFDDQIFNM